MWSVAVVTSGFPRLSETFLINELAGLEARGALAGIFATKPGDGSPIQPDAARLLSNVQWLPSGTPTEQAAAAARALRGHSVTGVHGYFAHTPAEVARLLAERLDVPFGFSAHARDVRKIEAAALSRQARLAACVVACNAEVAGVLQAAGAHVDHVPHGVDASRFRPGHRMRNGRLEILAVGRLVEKKGFEVLVDATRRLTSPFRLRIIGDGGLRDRLESAIGVDHRSRRHQVGRIELCSPRTHAELPDVYASSDVVVVPSVIDATGDRDGLPNVVLEAMASGVAVVGSDVAAIATAVVDGETGFLVPPGDPVALASRLEVLARDPHLTARLGRTGRERVEADFPLEGCIDRLCRVMRDAYG